MVNRVKEEAEALRAGVWIAVVDLKEVTAWALQTIGALPEPHWSLCELASTPQPSDLQRLLVAVPGTADSTVVWKLLVRLLHRRLKSDRGSAEEIASLLAQLATHTVEVEVLESDERYAALLYGAILDDIGHRHGRGELWEETMDRLLMSLDHLAGEERFSVGTNNEH